MTSLIRARWRVEIHEPSSPPPTIASSLERTVGSNEFRANFQTDRAIGRPTGSKLLISICFAPASLGHYLPIIAPLHEFPLPARIRRNWTFWRLDRLGLFGDNNCCLTWQWPLVFFPRAFCYQGGRDGEIDENCNGSEASTRGGGWSVGWWKWEAMRWSVINRERGENCILPIRDFSFLLRCLLL